METGAGYVRRDHHHCRSAATRLSRRTQPDAAAEEDFGDHPADRYCPWYPALDAREIGDIVRIGESVQRHDQLAELEKMGDIRRDPSAPAMEIRTALTLNMAAWK